MSGDEVRTAVIDTSVLINFAIVDRIGLLGALERIRFVVPAEVLIEVKRPEQKKRVRAALKAGVLQEAVLDQPTELAQFAGFRKQMGLGEAACLAVDARLIS